MECSIQEKNRLVTRYTNIFKSSGMPVKEAKQLANDRFNQVGKLGSVDQDTGIQPSANAVTEKISKDALEATLTTLGAISMPGVRHTTPEHMKELTEAVRELGEAVGDIQLTTDYTDSATRGDIVNNNITMNINSGLNETVVPMSPEEVFTHELVHAATRDALEDPANFDLRREVEHLWRATKKYLGDTYGNGNEYKIFLPKLSVDKALEEEAAKKQYNYIFGTSKSREITSIASDGTETKKEASVALHEFLAFARTNKELREQMSEFIFNVKNKKPTTFKEWVEYLWGKVLNAIVNKKLNTRGKLAVLSLDRLVNRLAYIQDKHSFNTRWLSSKLDKYNSKLANYIDKNALTKLEEWTFKELTNDSTETGSIYTALLAGVVNPKTHMQYRKMLKDLRRIGLLGYRSMLGSLFNEITRYTNEAELSKLIYWSKNYLDRASEVKRQAVATSITNSSKRKLSDDESEAVTRTFLKLDISSTNYTVQQYIDFLSDSGKVYNEIAKLSSELSNSPAKDYYEMQVKSLGYMLVNDVPLLDGTQMNNAHNIAMGYTFNGELDREVAKRYIPVLDKLATLHGILNLPTETKDISVGILKEDPEFVSHIVNLHKAFKEESLATNFNGKPHHTMKGYIADIFDPNVTLMVAPTDTNRDLRAQGYVRKGALKLSSLEDARDDYHLYVNNFDGLTARIKTAVSLTSESMKGASVKDRFLMNSNAAAVNSSYYIYTLAQKAISANPVLDSSSSHKLVPTIDEKGNIVDFRYMMNSSNKKTILKQDLDVATVLSNMYSNSLNKARSIEVNKKVTDFIYKDYQDNFYKDKSSFVFISPDSKDAELQEVYRLLPKEMRNYLISKYKTEGFYMREEWVRPLFAYRKLSMTSYKWLNKPVFKIAAMIVREIIGEAKKSIVVRIFSTLRNNIISNTLYLMIQGVPMEDAIKMQLEGIKLTSIFLKNEKTILDLELKLTNPNLAINTIEDMKGEIRVLRDSNNKNKIAPLIQANLFQTIAEEVDVANVADKYSMIGRFNDWAKPFSKTTAGAVVKDVLDQAFMRKGTLGYDFMLKATQYSDFVSRYALWQHKQRIAKEKGIPFNTDDTVNLALDMFINYELPTSPELQWAQDHGLILFTRYPLRILKALANTALSKPLNAFLGFFLLDRVMGDVSEPSDSYPTLDPGTILDLPDRLLTGITPQGAAHLIDAF